MQYIILLLVIFNLLAKSFAYEFLDLVIDKTQLRNMFKKTKKEKIDIMINQEFKNIYNHVLYNAQLNDGSYELYFDLFCYRRENTIPNSIQIVPSLMKDIYQAPSENLYKIKKNTLVSNTLIQLENYFPGTHITYFKQNNIQDTNGCNDYYSIAW